jgi:hydrogenase maturation factor HypF (carbamoyltransferase family)
VFSHSLIPSNDGGIALGQLAIAAKRREKGKIS